MNDCTEELITELEKQAKEVEEETYHIAELYKHGKLTYEQYLEQLLKGLRKAKERCAKRHGMRMKNLE